MKRPSQISILFFLLLAIGCNSQIETPTSLPVTATIENIETPKPSSTPTTSPSPTPEQITIEFPEWVKNPETQILLAPVGTRENGYENMALFNAETGERFDIPFGEEIDGFFWMTDGSKFGFIPKDNNKVIIFSITQGTVIEIALPDEAFQFISRGSGIEPVQLSSENIDSLNFVFLESYTEISADKKYFVLQNPCDEIFFCIFEVESGETKNLFSLRENHYYLFSEWSLDSKYLAVVETDEEPGNYYTFKNEPTFRLKVYDIKSQKLFASYKNITSAKWSPDGREFLYQSLTYNGEYFSFIYSMPCIFDTLSGETRCYDIDGRAAYVNWSPNQSMIGFIYTGNGRGFYTIDIESGERNRILEKLDLNEQMPRHYTWSPKGDYISFTYDTSCVSCDYLDDPQIGIANIMTGNYFRIGSAFYIFGEGLWRPQPSP
jgi:hypothetical protein